MEHNEQIRFDELYKRHLRALKLQGLSDKTIDVYARAVRRIAQHYDCCPDQLTTEQLETHFAELVESHSWSTVKVDRNGLQFFYEHVLKRDWSWVNIIKAPKIQSLPDILTLSEVEQLIGSCGSRIFMQPLADRHGEGHGRQGIQQHCRVPRFVRDDRPARRYPRTGVFATDGSNPDTTT